MNCRLFTFKKSQPTGHTAWNPFEIHLRSIWNPHQSTIQWIHVESTSFPPWNVQNMEIPHQFHHTMYNLHGIHINSTTQHRIHMDSMLCGRWALAARCTASISLFLQCYINFSSAPHFDTPLCVNISWHNTCMYVVYTIVCEH